MAKVDVMEKVLSDTVLQLAAKKERVTKGTAYLASLREEIRRLEKKSESAQDTLAKTKYKAQELLARRKAEKSLQAVALSSASRFGQNTTGLSPGAQVAAFVAEQEAKRLGVKCSRLLAKYKEILAKVLSLESAIQEAKDEIESELSVIADLKREQPLADKAKKALENNLEALGSALDLSRKAIAKSTDLKNALLRFCERSRTFNFSTVTESDYPAKAVLEWRLLPAVTKKDPRRGSSSDLHDNSLQLETKKRLEEAVRCFEATAGVEVNEEDFGEEDYHEIAKSILEKVSTGVKELENAEETFEHDMKARLEALAASVRSVTGQDTPNGRNETEVAVTAPVTKVQSQPMDFSKNDERVSPSVETPGSPLLFPDEDN